MPLVTVLGEPERAADRDDRVADLRRASESPSESGCRIDDGASTLITARSVERSVPTSVAL